MQTLPDIAERTLERIERSLQSPPALDPQILQSTLSDLLEALGSPVRPTRPFPQPASAAVEVCVAALADARTWFAAQLDESASVPTSRGAESRIAHSLDTGIRSAIEGHFDEQFAHALSDIEATAQIAASTHDRIDHWQSAYRRCRELLETGGCTRREQHDSEAIEAAIAPVEFDVSPASWSGLDSSAERLANTRHLSVRRLAADEDLRDAGRDRLRRHRVSLVELLPSAAALMVCGDLQECAHGVNVAGRLLTLWECGARTLWVCRDRIVAA